MGKRLTAAFVLISTSLLGQFAAPAQASAKCPLKLSHLDLRYRHTGGTSRPQVDLSFTNVAENKIVRISFSLSILDSGGYPHPYEDSLVFSKGADPDKPVSHLWALNAASVDIHHTGESLEVESVEFADGSAWHGDGSSECTITVDFHPQ